MSERAAKHTTVMKSILKDTVDKHAPFVIKHVKGKKSPWMSKEIKRHMNIHDQLYRKAQIKKAIRLGFIQTRSKLHKKRNPKNQKKLYLQRIKRHIQ